MSNISKINLPNTQVEGHWYGVIEDDAPHFDQLYCEGPTQHDCEYCGSKYGRDDLGMCQSCFDNCMEND